MLTAFALALLTETPPIDPRANLLRFCARLEQRLATASRPAEPMVLMSGLPETRFVYIDGVGPVFLLPPRSLPAKPPARSGQTPPEVSVSTTRPGSTTAGPQVMVLSRPNELTELEARIRQTRKEAERMRAQAEAAFADAERQLMTDLHSGPLEAIGGAGIAPPWTFLLEDTVDETRTPEEIERDVREALINTIVDDASLLRSLHPTDIITVSVDLVSRAQPWMRVGPTRTLTIRAQKADLDAFASGRLPKEDLLKRLQTKAY